MTRARKQIRTWAWIFLDAPRADLENTHPSPAVYSPPSVSEVKVVRCIVEHQGGVPAPHPGDVLRTMGRWSQAGFVTAPSTLGPYLVPALVGCVTN
jgi:hypothetical protein